MRHWHLRCFDTSYHATTSPAARRTPTLRHRPRRIRSARLAQEEEGFFKRVAIFTFEKLEPRPMCRGLSFVARSCARFGFDQTQCGVGCFVPFFIVEESQCRSMHLPSKLLKRM